MSDNFSVRTGGEGLPAAAQRSVDKESCLRSTGINRHGPACTVQDQVVTQHSSSVNVYVAFKVRSLVYGGDSDITTNPQAAAFDSNITSQITVPVEQNSLGVMCLENDRS